MLGQLDGKLDSLIESFRQYQTDHNARHVVIDTKIDAAQTDINQAKGAKTALIAAAAAISGFVGIAIAAAERMMK